jgi:hypothetical protein
VLAQLPRSRIEFENPELKGWQLFDTRHTVRLLTPES